MFRQLTPSLLTDAPVVPVGLVIDKALSVIEQRVEHDQASQLRRVRSSVITTDPATEASAEQSDTISTDLRPNQGDGGADVSKNTSDREIFLTPFTLPVTTQITTQRRNANLSQPERQPSEKTPSSRVTPPPCTKTAA
jgi:hypothetical protein